MTTGLIGDVWTSPDGKIRKEVLVAGTIHRKPTENCECTISIKDICGVLEEVPLKLVVGESDTKFRRLLDKCLIFMNKGETARVTFELGEEIIFTLELVTFLPSKLIYQLTAKEKLELAQKHRESGNRLFKQNRHVDASHRFGKSLKLLCSIPIEIDEPDEETDGVKLTEINDSKVVLYNNLASCYLRNSSHETVIEICQKIFELDPDNVKALYKHGVAWYETGDYDKSHKSLSQVLELDPNNKAAEDKLKACAVKVQQANIRVNSMIKKMFLV